MKKTLLINLILFFVLNVFTTNTNAQVAAIPFTASLDSFSVITGTTVDAQFVDDVSYQGIPIGFTFNYGGISHDYMSVNTNGYIELDSAGTGSFYSILSGTHNNVVAPFGADLIHYDSTASLQYATIGTAPNRICIIQWLHYSYFGNSGDVSFQLWLEEGSNCIRFIYGNNVLTSTPLNTQIGLRGSTNQDFLVLGDTACNWANAYPYTSISTIFPVSLSCNMPSGFAFHFGACTGTAVDFSYLTGTIFNDLNGDGIRDTNETGIPNRVINLNQGNYFVSTDAAGNYAFFYFDSTLTYTLTTGGITYWNFTTPMPISCNPLTQATSNLNFGLQMIPNIHEVSVTCPNWGAKPGQLEPMPISYQNNGTTTESDTISFLMDSLYTFVSSNPVPAVQNGQLIQWAYSNLAPGQHGFIMLQLMPSLSAVLGDTLYSTLTIGPMNDTIPANNTVNLHQLVTLAWDPNEKAAVPAGDIEAGTEIHYTIHFQNTGNATASNVIVRDTLDSGLDLLSFRLLGSSHSMNMSMDGNGIAEFIFFNIQLPDSGSDLAGSNGFVSYALRAKSNLTPGISIYNRAGIVFDTNIPILTNTTVNTIRLETGVSSHATSYPVSLFPNPASNLVRFEFSKNLSENGNLEISSLEGKIILRKNKILSTETVNIGDLPAGIYICTVSTIDKVFTAKLVKE